MAKGGDVVHQRGMMLGGVRRHEAKPREPTRCAGWRMPGPPSGAAGGLSRFCFMPSDAAKHHAALMDDVTAFRHYIATERGMASNTVLAYGRDLDRFAAWVTNGGLSDYLHPSVR